jgi:hypothetical protein
MTQTYGTFSIDARQDGFAKGDSGQPFRHGRLDIARFTTDFKDQGDPPLSQRQFARQHGVPVSTLNYHLNKPPCQDLDPAFEAFFHSPQGETFLRWVVLALLLVFHHANACGLRTLSRFLQLTRLDRFVASSTGALHSLARQVGQAVTDFGDSERSRLAALMRHKDIVLCPDENFHEQRPCLVAIEPVSNFILLEEYQDRRDAKTWNASATGSLLGLDVTVVLVCSDQASGLVCFTEDFLGVPHQPDLLHLQRDLAKPLLTPLASPIQKAQKDLEKATAKTESLQQALDEAEAGRPPARRIDFFCEILESARDEHKAKERLQEARQTHEKAAQALRGISDDYHPFDRNTGDKVSPEQMEKRLGKRLLDLEAAVGPERISAKGEEALGKAFVWTKTLVASLGWFFGLVEGKLQELDLPEAQEEVVREKLLPGLYWEAAARRGRGAEEQAARRELAQSLLASARAKEGPLGRLVEEEREQVEQAALDLVGLFSRSSSCVEGRNGRLSLLRHGHTRLSSTRLKVQTVLHNFFAKRPDGSTAAERFFEHTPKDLFSCLLDNMPDLPRPAAKRPCQPAED